MFVNYSYLIFGLLLLSLIYMEGLGWVYPEGSPRWRYHKFSVYRDFYFTETFTNPSLWNIITGVALCVIMDY